MEPGSLSLVTKVGGVLQLISSCQLMFPLLDKELPLQRISLADRGVQATCLPAAPAGPGSRVRLIYRLAKVPVMHTEWFWASAFSFAVSSSCLQAHEVICVKSVVLQCLTEFAWHMAGVGIAGK